MLGRWISENVSFPNTMVDRITPVTEEQHRVWQLIYNLVLKNDV